MAGEQQEARAREALSVALQALEQGGETVPVTARTFRMSHAHLWALAHELRVERCPDASISWRNGALTFKFERATPSRR